MTLEFSSVAEMRAHYAGVTQTFQSYVEPPHVPKTRPYNPRPLSEIIGLPKPPPPETVLTFKRLPKARDWLIVCDFDLLPGSEIRVAALSPIRVAVALLNSDPLWIAIAKEVAAKHHVTVREMRSPRRSVELCRARYEAWFRTKNETAMSLPAIGRKYNRDHTTILHGLRRYEELMGAQQG